MNSSNHITLECDDKHFVNSGQVIWVTGLSGAGKTTLCKALVKKMLKEEMNPVFFDGDELREIFRAVDDTEHYDRNGRLKLALQYSHLCRVLAEQGFVVLIATISLFKEVHAWNRENLPGYLEVFLNVPLSELRNRDSKEIYSRYDRGELNNVAGLDIDIDEPEDADFVIDFDATSSNKTIVNDLMASITGHSRDCCRKIDYGI